MKKKQLGKSGLEIAPLVFGGNVFGWTVDEKSSFKLLDAFIDAGFNLVDTADVYSTWVRGNRGGESEQIIGNWLTQRNNRDKIIIATKVGKEMGPGKTGLSKKYIRQEVEESLKRLQTDYIDLYQAHADDPDTPIEETLETFTELVREGKVRAIGASNFTATRLATCLAVSNRNGYAKYESLQPAYNLYDRSFEKELEPICREQGVGVISYYALASGFLTGKYRSTDDLSQSARGKSVQKYLNDRGFRILKALDEVAKKYHTIPASVSIAWIQTNEAITAPIASATSVEQLNVLMKASELKLDQESIELLNDASR